MKRKEYKSNAPWEDVIGYNRAIKVGNIVEVAGTTAVDQHGETIGDNYYEQTCFILKKIEKALHYLDFNKEDVIRTRIYVLDINYWESVAKAHKEFFSINKPVNTLIETSKFIQNDLLIEIEVTAIKNR